MHEIWMVLQGREMIKFLQMALIHTIVIFSKSCVTYLIDTILLYKTNSIQIIKRRYKYFLVIMNMQEECQIHFEFCNYHCETDYMKN